MAEAIAPSWFDVVVESVYATDLTFDFVAFDFLFLKSMMRILNLASSLY